MKTGTARQSKVRVTLTANTFTLGWWMVMSEDEQGYAPASYLEPLNKNSEEEETDLDVYPENNSNQGTTTTGHCV